MAAAGVRLLAITDHDSLAGYRLVTLPTAPALPPGLQLIAGVEINAVTRGFDVPDGELHILGYGVDPADDHFEATLERQRGSRRIRFDATVARLREIGLPIDTQIAGLAVADDAALGRPTIARALIAAGHIGSVEDAFRDLLSWGRPAYVPREGLGPLEAVRAIRAAGGLASLAHFPQAADRIDVVRALIDAGLDGLEVFHRSFDDAQRASVGEVAQALNLVATGGTDFHGDYGPYAGSHAELVIDPEVAVRVPEAIARLHGR